MNRYKQKIEEVDKCFRHAEIEFKNKNTSVSDAELSIIERDLGCRLPNDYKELLRDYAGYIFSSSPQFPLMGGHEKTGAIARFFGGARELIDEYRDACNSEWPFDVYRGITLIRPLEELDVEPLDHEQAVWVKWPFELLPIANNGGSDVICLAVFGSHCGSIYYWITNPITSYEPNIYKVSSSFDQFMRLLCKNEDSI